MLFPCETAVKSFIPKLRAVISVRLYREGWTQKRIADVLGITQAAVTKYLSMELSIEPWIEEIAERVVAVLLSGGNREAVIFEVCKSCLVARDSGPMCKMHRGEVGLDEECDICYRAINEISGELGERRGSISRYRSFLKMLVERVRNAKEWMPEVRTNLVFSRDIPHEISEVIGIPGRISEFRGRLIPYSPPQYGGSGHLSVFLIKVANSWKWPRAVICLKNTSRVMECLKNRDIKIINLQRSTDAPAVTLVPDISPEGPAIAIADPGWFGIEPVIYLVCSTLETLVSIVLDVDACLQ